MSSVICNAVVFTFVDGSVTFTRAIGCRKSAWFGAQVSWHQNSFRLFTHAAHSENAEPVQRCERREETRDNTAQRRTDEQEVEAEVLVLVEVTARAVLVLWARKPEGAWRIVHLRQPPMPTHKV